MKVTRCISCACTEDKACDDGLGGGCSWLMVDRALGVGVCSACPRALSRWARGGRQVRGRFAIRFTRAGKRPEWLDDSTATLRMPNKTAEEEFARRFAKRGTAGSIVTRLNKIYRGWKVVETEIRT